MGLLIVRIIIAVLALIGATTIVRMLSFVVVVPKKSKGAFVLLLDGDDADMQLMFAVEKVKCGFFEGKIPIVAVDNGIDKYTRRRCEMVAEGADVIFCDGESEFAKLMKFHSVSAA